MSASAVIRRVAGTLGLVVAVAMIGALASTLHAGASLDPRPAGGDFTLQHSDAKALIEPAPVLTFKQRQTFMRGRHHFNQRWVQFPSLAGDWGLGPTFNADRCSVCHINAGRGVAPRASQAPVSVLVRVAIPGFDDQGHSLAVPGYGHQIQNRGLMGEDRDATFLGERVRPEADIAIGWREFEVKLADGESVSLREPVLQWKRLYFGQLPAEVQTSLRIAQPLVGLGLLEAVPERALRELAKRQRWHGVNGRLNEVWDDINGRKAVGRFGWKANQPSIAQQIAAAFAEDLGVTSRLYNESNCPAPQADCAAQPPGNQPELINIDWEQLVFWTQTLAVPAWRNTDDPEFQEGERLFEAAKCAICHVPSLRTGGTHPTIAQLAGQTFWPYTDLRLHDMGEGLADGKPDFAAGPRDWRTPALWAIGLTRVVSGAVTLLHDGRARSLSEAILWHGGEAQMSREAFVNMTKRERQSLLKFLSSI